MDIRVSPYLGLATRCEAQWCSKCFLAFMEHFDMQCLRLLIRPSNLILTAVFIFKNID